MNFVDPFCTFVAEFVRSLHPGELWGIKTYQGKNHKLLPKFPLFEQICIRPDCLGIPLLPWQSKSWTIKPNKKGG